MTGWAAKTQHAQWAVVRLIGYSAFLRPAEMCALTLQQSRTSLVLHLYNAKTGRGSVELVVIDDADVVRIVKQIRARIVD